MLQIVENVCKVFEVDLGELFITSLASILAFIRWRKRQSASRRCHVATKTSTEWHIFHYFVWSLHAIVMWELDLVEPSSLHRIAILWNIIAHVITCSWRGTD